MEIAIIIPDSNDLKQQLDRIDAELAEKVAKPFFESRMRIYVSQWEKGKVLVKYRGVNLTSFNKLQEETGRPRQTLKIWHDLAEKYLTRMMFMDQYAKPKAEAWTTKALTTPAPKLIGETTEIIDVTEKKTDKEIILEQLYNDVKEMKSVEQILTFIKQSFYYE